MDKMELIRQLLQCNGDEVCIGYTDENLCGNILEIGEISSLQGLDDNDVCIDTYQNKNAILASELLRLKGDELINGINPKLMKDILTYRNLIPEKGWDSFAEKIGERRMQRLFDSVLMNPHKKELESNSPIYKVTVVELYQKDIKLIIDGFKQRHDDVFDGEDGFLDSKIISIEEIKW
ncbi:MAG: hypothetical protein IJF83_05720 [Methanobrevibacter sp.]|nr:hypothetical protein [Methanobrevibacter sp.]